MKCLFCGCNTAFNPHSRPGGGSNAPFCCWLTTKKIQQKKMKNWNHLSQLIVQPAGKASKEESANQQQAGT